VIVCGPAFGGAVLFVGGGVLCTAGGVRVAVVRGGAGVVLPGCVCGCVAGDGSVVAVGVGPSVRWPDLLVLRADARVARRLARVVAVALRPAVVADGEACREVERLAAGGEEERAAFGVPLGASRINGTTTATATTTTAPVSSGQRPRRRPADSGSRSRCAAAPEAAGADDAVTTTAGCARGSFRPSSPAPAVT